MRLFLLILAVWPVIPAAAQATLSPPTTEIVAAPAASTADRYAVFTFQATDASGFECRLDGEAVTVCASPFTALDLDIGAHVFVVRALDAQGNPGASTMHAWDVVSVFELPNPGLAHHGVAPEPDPDGGSFRIKCELSHGNYDDPIVYPGQSGVAHLHTYYGNELTDAASDETSLFTTSTTTCDGDVLNRSSYWVPALIFPEYDEAGDPGTHPNGHSAFGVVRPTSGPFATDIYYKAGVDDLASIQPMPRGLRMIAGNAAMGPQENHIVRWSCESWVISSADDFLPHVPACDVGDAVRLTITFPPCWNGVDLDVPDHHSHMAYVTWSPEAGIHCPASHPVALPQVSYNFAFPVTTETVYPFGDSRAWRLASDMYEVSAAQPGGLSAHGDWFMAWHPEVMETFVEHCLHTGRHCAGGDLGNGWRLVGMRPGSGVMPVVHVAGSPTASTHEHAGHGEPSSNHPNPFSDRTTISYTLTTATHVRLAVFDVLGRVVAVLVDENVPAGSHQTTFDADALPNGVYYYRLDAGTQREVGRMTLAR